MCHKVAATRGPPGRELCNLWLPIVSKASSSEPRALAALSPWAWATLATEPGEAAAVHPCPYPEHACSAYTTPGTLGEKTSQLETPKQGRDSHKLGLHLGGVEDGSCPTMDAPNAKN